MFHLAVRLSTLEASVLVFSLEKVAETFWGSTLFSVTETEQ